MTQLKKPNRDLWLWLFNEGGRYTVNEIANKYEWHIDFAMACVYSMRRNNLIEQFVPAVGSRRKRYGVTGNCVVPTGFCVAEVQA